LANKGYTVKYRLWKVVYIEAYDTKTTAIKRENWLKSRNARKFIAELKSAAFISA
jgi:putative endonuclease